MVSVLEAPADKLILRVAEILKTQNMVKPPEWLTFVKTGAHVQRKPHDKDFWFMRCASMLRRSYMEGNIGVGRLRTWYGGRRNVGTRPEHHADAGGKVIREAFKQLETAGLVKKEKVGRTLTPKGRSLLDKACMEFYGGERRGRQPGSFKAAEAEQPPAKPKRTGGKRRTRKTDGTPEKTPDGQTLGTESKTEDVQPEGGKPAASKQS